MRRLNAHSPSSSLDPNPEKIMDSVKSQSRSIHNWKKIRENLSVFIAVSVILSVLGYLLLRGGGGGNLKKKFSIVIDGGSTGTRIHVFGYNIDNGDKPVIKFGKEEVGSMRVTPGLSTFETDTESAGKSLIDLLEFGKEKIPKEYWEDTEIRLMATAGLRRLEKRVLERILESCRRVLRFSGFKFEDHWASVISGSDEGMYAWVAANYALGTLGGDPQHTTGIIELGGASAQVTFVSSEPLSPEFTSKVKIGELTYNLYSHSLLHFGQNVAHDTLMELLVSKEWKLSRGTIQDERFFDPCTPRGYLNSLESSNFSPVASSEKSKDLSNLRARGNFSECRSAALKVLQKGKDKCNYKLCNIGSTFIPKLQGKFLATENFFHTSKFFGLPPRAFLSNLALAGEQFCNEDLSKLKSKYPTLDKDDFQRYCFSSAYIIALLHDSLGVALDDKRVEYAQQVGDIPLDWALGAFILQNSGGPHDWVGNIVGDDTSALFSFFVVSVILIFTAWSVTKWRKPQLKTIYDLEKGRYIVTRVAR
ncbi:hypothetical protein MKW94_011999 [Papaver nudicaule]|uniref:Apyrase 6 n=1 Tax=Papaver nudicaule TaxID=74823 RepID=A0AA42B422_PAPNU|nr:hypothetical protein [Papaver nudicaule]